MCAEYASNEIPPKYTIAAEFESVFGQNSTFDWKRINLRHYVYKINDQGKCESRWIWTMILVFSHSWFSEFKMKIIKSKSL